MNLTRFIKFGTKPALTVVIIFQNNLKIMLVFRTEEIVKISLLNHILRGRTLHHLSAQFLSQYNVLTDNYGLVFLEIGSIPLYLGFFFTSKLVLLSLLVKQLFFMFFMKGWSILTSTLLVRIGWVSSWFLGQTQIDGPHTVLISHII